NDDAADAGIRTAAEQVIWAVNEAVSQAKFLSGSPQPFSDRNWDWERFGGLSVYLPIGADEARRDLYKAASLAWAADTSWDEFLDAFWEGEATPPQFPCDRTTEHCDGLAPRPKVEDLGQVFLPLIVRR
ncbi:MAG: hypothetical protein KDD83_04630, partial [Caldilineaceae bacterium]|nr:hypothetical protein [Caldilineaceae bacterium]